MKKGFIVGKRQIAIAALILALGGAVWLNMEYAGGNTYDNYLGDTSSKVLGQAQYVGAQAQQTGSGATEDFFAKTRADRKKAREDAVKLLQTTVDNVKTDETARKQAQDEIARIAKDIETEAAIESLIKAKGFKDAVAVLSADDISVVVKKEDKLLASETMQIMDIASAKTNFSADKIKILTSK